MRAMLLAVSLTLGLLAAPQIQAQQTFVEQVKAIDEHYPMDQLYKQLSLSGNQKVALVQIQVSRQKLFNGRKSVLMKIARQLDEERLKPEHDESRISRLVGELEQEIQILSLQALANDKPFIDTLDAAQRSQLKDLLARLQPLS